MALNTGTLAMADLQAMTTATVTDIGEAAVVATFQRSLDTHNRILAQAVANIAEITSDPLRRVGGAASGEMIKANEYSRAPTQKPLAGGTVGFPKELFQYAIGWTQRFLNKTPVSELTKAQLAAQTAHARKVMVEMKRAIYAPTNVSTTDYLERNAITLPVKRFYNADSWNIPDGPNGETFTGSSHSHYLAYATLTAAAALALVNTVAEHTTNARIQVAINAADETAWSALTGFKPYTDARLISGNTDGNPLARLDISNPGNRAIGLMGLGEVWVKPWAIANYPVAYDTAAPEKPLILRTPSGQNASLVRAAENNAFPLIAQYYESEFGFGAFNRGAAAVLFIGDTTYAEPTITG